MIATGLAVQLLPLALATVISPIVFISLFLVLQGDRAVLNGTIFVVGLVAAVGVTSVFAAYVVNGKVSNGSGTDTGISWFNLILGVAELSGGIYLKFKGPKPGHDHVPAFLDRIQRAPWPLIFVIGILVPTYPAAISAGSILLRASDDAESRGVAVFVYLFLCALIVGAPVIFVAIRGKQATMRMREATEWLVFHSSTVGAGILIVVGIYLITAFL